jgi:hypothetical protein
MQVLVQASGDNFALNQFVSSLSDFRIVYTASTQTMKMKYLGIEFHFGFEKLIIK